MDAPIQEGWKQTVGEVTESQGKIMAWQTRGEIVSVSHQLSSGSSMTGMEVVEISKEVIIQTPEQKLDVVEGIAVVTKDADKIENNIYLKAPTSINPSKATEEE